MFCYKTWLKQLARNSSIALLAESELGVALIKNWP